MAARPFSSTPRRAIDPVSILTSGPIFLMDTLHSLGLSWSMVIPCTALVLRGGVTYYLFTLPQRRRNRQRAAVTPLIRAYANRYCADPRVTEKLWDLKRKRNDPVSIQIYMLSVTLRANIQGWWKFGYLTGQGRWRIFGSPLGNYGILLTAMEAIREKCGGKQGFLSLLFTPITAIWKAAGSLEFPQAADATAANSNVTSTIIPPVIDRTQQIGDSTISADLTRSSESISVGEAGTLKDSMAAPVHSTLDPTLQTEGPWFCPDLTSADPTGTLPLAVLAAVAIPAILSPQIAQTGRPVTQLIANTQPTAPLPTSYKRRMSLGLTLQLFFAVYFYHISLFMPAGMVLYLISSFSIGFMRRLWLDVRYPTVKAIEPCLRPVRQNRRKYW